ncbi:DUF2238 domain-containing protein [Novosphingobium sp.]|uniref:DUF2238 domain-containing protein n=1 Tax=Novosphingobium sp. TaxID=1874826 RepID=UPI00286E61B7|nr:DUF2238 domain-containing protein [Novosphingobium sp.]
MIAAIVLAIPASVIGAIYPENTWLQVGPVAILFVPAILALRRWPVSNASALCFTLFVLIHLIAARWSYSYVPYREWIGQAVEVGTDRNMFDRLVHFLFGLLAIMPITEVGVRYGGLSKRVSLTGAVLFVLAIGGLYEIFEWSLTLLLAPQDAGAYNGEQGDIFDSQKDMAMAALGAALALWPATGTLTKH